MSSAITPAGLNSPDLPKRSKGRPRGSGRKQQLAALGEWMNNSAGLAFTPHVIHVAAGEDVAANIYSFAQQRPRALCILSASGTVSAVTLRQPTSSDDEAAATYEGRFEILCLSGSYLVAENGGPRNRTGGLSISICSQDGHVLGGALGGKLIASNPVQVIACSFVYGGAKPKTDSKPEKKEVVVAGEKSTSTPPTSVDPSQNPNLGSSVVAWPLGSTNSRPESRDPHRDIDLTRG
jgi:predicted DNA-binding protein with PD1-like motif